MKSDKKVLFWSLVIGLIFTLITTYAKNVQSDVASEMIRLHVIANSDSEDDQALKLEVRDEIIKQTSHLFKNCKTIEETRVIAQSNLNEIRSAAQSVIVKNGANYTIRVETGEFTFPTKSYEGILLPAGNYYALRVIIGEGGGQNWWCVLFPPLCFTNGVTPSLPPQSMEYLEQNMSEEDYKMIAESDNVSTEIRFKIVELLAPLFGK